MEMKLAVLDFDGNLTYAEREAVPALEGYKNDVAHDLGIDRPKLDIQWQDYQRIVEQNPTQYGWKNDGKIVAPAHADSWVMALTIATQILENVPGFEKEGAIRDALNRYFRENYKKSSTVFKEGADEFLSAVSSRMPASIVTNSGTEGVMKKLAQLSADHSDIGLYGDAKKYVLDDNWTEVPESIEREGFGRPLFLRRKMYGNILEKLMKEHNAKPEEVVVMGDIFELDLLLPLYLGMHIMLNPNDSTAEYEINAVQNYERGHVVRSLEEALDFLK